MHAHIDAFSGAAGDMLLAACLDAADSLPHPLQLSSITITADDGDDSSPHLGAPAKNSDRLLSRIVRDLENGLPELRGEFELTAKGVWRGVGRIAAKKVDVRSVYNHKAAPVPGSAAAAADARAATQTREGQHSHDHKHQHDHDRDHQSGSADGGDDGGEKKDPLSQGGTSHEHSHSHGHSHKTAHDYSHSHDHDHSHDHSHSHDHGHQSGKLRNLPQIKQMLQDANSDHIPNRVADLAIEAFTALAHAERRTHGAESIEQVHFHEVGAVDSIVDTVGTLLAMHHLGVDLGDGDGRGVSVTCSPLPIGEGTVWTDHGLLPVPAPATLRLMIGMPTCPGPKGVTGELVTPTAAALLRVLTGVASGEVAGRNNSYWQAAKIPGRPPHMIPRSVGIGAGSKDFERHPNVVRLILGDLNVHQQTSNSTSDVADAVVEAIDSNIMEEDTVKVSDSLHSNVEKNGSKTVVNKELNEGQQSTAKLWEMHTLTHGCANIDDSTPELLAHAIELLLKNGAIDAWIHPIVMKKGRPAHNLHFICHCEEGGTNAGKTQNGQPDIENVESRLLGILFRNTTTLGIRIQRNILRAALKRQFVEVQLPYRDNVRDGKVDVKISSLNDGEIMSIKAEFDHCKAVSEGSNVPLKVVSNLAERLASP